MQVRAQRDYPLAQKDRPMTRTTAPSTLSVAVPVDHVPSVVRTRKPALILSIADPDCSYTPMIVERAVAGLDIPVVALRFHNVDGNMRHGDIAATPAALQPAVEAVRALPHNAFVLVHCSMGESRSPAIALLVRALQDPDWAEDVDGFVQAWRKDHPNAQPNMRVVACADAVLDQPRTLSRAIRTLIPTRG